MRPGMTLPPDGAEYWERLAARIERAAAEGRNRPLLVSLGARGLSAAGLGAAAAALVLLWTLGAQPRDEQTAERGATWVAALSPSDSLGRRLSVEEPPPLPAFILAGVRRAREDASPGVGLHRRRGTEAPR